MLCKMKAGKGDQENLFLRISTNPPIFISTSHHHLWISLVSFTEEYFGGLVMPMAHFLLDFPL